MRALVTGAAGFLGSTLTDSLLRDGHEVVGVDCFTANYDVALKRENLKSALAQGRFRFVEADLRQVPLEPLLDGVTHVAHLAALPGVRGSWGESFREYAEHNVLATQRLLEAARFRAPERMAVASSSSVYGVPVRFPTPEDEPPRPLSPYGVTKAAVDALLHAYRSSFGLQVVALRYFTVYGPRQRPDMGIHKFFEAARRSEPAVIYGDGSQTRDFTFVDDAVSATKAALSRPAPELAYNVGGGHRISVNRLLDAMERVSGRPIERRHVDPPPGDPPDTSADTTRAGRDLGWKPGFDLEEGLRRQWAWQSAR